MHPYKMTTHKSEASLKLICKCWEGLKADISELSNVTTTQRDYKGNDTAHIALIGQ